SHPGFTARGTLPYHRTPRGPVRGFGGGLSPGTSSAHAHSTSELLRTLSRVAASKPTSWLSARAHLLAHSARTWGPRPAVSAGPGSPTKLSPRRLTAPAAPAPSPF